jgi:hypothetical protein
VCGGVGKGWGGRVRGVVVGSGERVGGRGGW